MRRRPRAYRPLTISATHWRQDGEPKVRYETRSEALGAASERASEAGIELQVYRCGYCQGWHMARRQDRPEWA